MAAILGINALGYNTSACLLVDGALTHAICEERLSRIKRDRAFPLRAIEYCCAGAGLRFDEVDEVYVGWHPRHYVRASDQTLIDARRARGKVSYLALNELATRVPEELTDVGEWLATKNHRWEVRFVDHHQAHLANAFYNSGFDEADFLILDHFGEGTTGMAGGIGPKGIDIFCRYPFPHSMGAFYTAFTDFLGFKGASDEWKVMALSALGDPEPYYRALRPLLRADGIRFELDLSYFEHFLFFRQHYYAQKMIDLIGPPLPKDAEPGRREWDIVAAVQRISEETVFDLARALHARTGRRKLLVGGGFFMNSVCNGKLLENTPYEAVFIGGSPEDSGISVGSALDGLCRVRGEAFKTPNDTHNYFGRSYSRAEIKAELDRRKLRYAEPADLAGEVARQIAGGKIVGWFQGASELGQRALGNRSILADPRRAEMKDLVNASVKYREGFRPFAPAVLRERQHEILDMPAGESAYFMEKVFRIKPEWRSRIPAVTHFDGSGRAQTVDAAVNPRFYALIDAFARETEVPVVLNTSFNVNEMPMVESPADALTCFYACGLDTLALGGFVLEK